MRNTCYSHPPAAAVGTFVVGVDELPGCVTCLVETVEEDIYTVAFYDADGEDAVLAELERRDHEAVG